MSTRSRRKQTAAPQSPSSLKQSSPQKARGGKDSKPGSSKTLESFFRNPPPAALQRPRSPERPKAAEQDTLIEDIEDDDFAALLPRDTQDSDAKERKRSWTVAIGGRAPSGPRAVSNKFIKTPSPQAAQSPVPSSAVDAGERPWTEQYSPRDLNELAVHHKKVADVRHWFEGVFKGQIYQRLLVLRGSAGTGKSTTVSLLSRELGCELVEWRNPEVSAYGNGPYVSTSAMFAEFMSRAGKFGGLELTSASKPSHTASGKEPSRPERQILMMEEFPSTSGGSSVALAMFREQLVQYLAANARPKSTLAGTSSTHAVPLVLVVSESILSSSSSADNFTAHRLLGGDILQHPGVTVIDFNAVAPTFISKALKLVISKHTRHVGRAQASITPGMLKVLSEVGDVRNAVGTLEYLSKDPALASHQPSLTARASTKTKSRSKAAPSPDDAALEEKAMSLIALREGSIGLFHAIGKVVYNKRGGDVPSEAGGRPRPDLDVDLVLSSSGTDPPTFLSALHENYALSCFDQYGDSEATLDSINGCLDAMGDADVLGTTGTTGQGRGSRQYAPAGSEGVRQEELALHVGMMGIQSALPYPVKRQAVGELSSNGGQGHKGGRGEQHRMYYPMELKLWRQREEVQSSVDFLVRHTLDGRLTAALSSVQWGRTTNRAGRAASSEETTVTSAPAYTDISSGQSARQMMLLERLPYLKRIRGGQGGKVSATAAHYMRRVDEVTSFVGLKARQDDESDEEDRERGLGEVGFGAGNKEEGSEAMEKLMLDDDPISDDE